jgi:hypothetical protein
MPMRPGRWPEVVRYAPRHRPRAHRTPVRNPSLGGSVNPLASACAATTSPCRAQRASLAREHGFGGGRAAAGGLRRLGRSGVARRAAEDARVGAALAEREGFESSGWRWRNLQAVRDLASQRLETRANFDEIALSAGARESTGGEWCRAENGQRTGIRDELRVIGSASDGDARHCHRSSRRRRPRSRRPPPRVRSGSRRRWPSDPPTTA